MKKTMNSIYSAGMLLLLLAGTVNSIAQQATPASQLRYKEVVVENPNAEADMKVVADFVNALTNADLIKAKSLLTANYLGYGPAPTDSTTADQTITDWKENYKIQTNRTVSFVTQTFKVLSGNLMGNWVSLWGDYGFTQNGKKVSFPFQYTARVNNGKIDTDRIYYDRMFILQSLGYTLTPPASSE